MLLPLALPGKSVSMNLETWANVAGYEKGFLSEASTVNEHICGNDQPGGVVLAADGTTNIAVNDCAPLRLTGAEIMINLDYKNKEFHGERDHLGRSKIRGDCGAGNSASGMYSWFYHRFSQIRSMFWGTDDDYDCFVVAYVSVKRNSGKLFIFMLYFLPGPGNGMQPYWLPRFGFLV